MKMRCCLVMGWLLVVAIGTDPDIAAQPAGDKKNDKRLSLQEKIAKADMVVVGKVTEVGLSAASSFDVGAIEVREILKGNGKIKAAKFRFPSRGDEAAAVYGKKGVDGVWILGKEGGYMDAREVLSFQPLTDLNTVKDLIAKMPKGVQPPKDDKK
jgi:hypothetical protein